MQMKIANIRKEKTRINETQTSEKGQTQRAIRTLEIKLERVSHQQNTCYWQWQAVDEFCFIVLYYFYHLDCVLPLIIQALTHFSEQLMKNSELRKELQTLHVEQIRFQQLRDRLEKVGPEICFSLVVFNVFMCVFLCYI